MSNHNTGIEWTHIPGYKGETWNPVRGCRRVSEGCRNCYAERMSARFSGEGQPYEGLAEFKDGEPRWTGESMIVENKFDQPLRWTKPRAVFVNSMSDLFFEGFDFETIAAIYGVMAAAREHVFMVLTKRPERARVFFQQMQMEGRESGTSPLAAIQSYALTDFSGEKMKPREIWNRGDVQVERGESWPPVNIWLGTSVEDQSAADERIPHLLECPAAVRFLSCEPLLGPVHLGETWMRGAFDHCPCEGGDEYDVDPCRGCPGWGMECGAVRGPSIDWVIAGGESGPGARPMHPDWPRHLRDQCDASGTPFFFKQWGAYAGDPSVAEKPDVMVGTLGQVWHEGDQCEFHESVGATPMARVGKHDAGRKLDGEVHSEFPEVSR
jgi:protein gp37